MEKELVEIYLKNKKRLEEILAHRHPRTYLSLVTDLIHILEDENYGDSPNPAKITEVAGGHYNYGWTYAFIIESHNQEILWCVAISYGSCAECDLLSYISEACQYCSCEDDECNSSCADKPTSEEIAQYLNLALHIVQRLQKISIMALESLLEV